MASINTPLDGGGRDRYWSVIPGRKVVKPIRILLINNEDIVKAGLKSLIERSPEMSLQAEAGTASEAIEVIKTNNPDLVIMDLELARENCLDALNQLANSNQPVSILLLCGQNDIELCIRAIKMGGSGLVRKSEPADVLAEAIRRVAAGEAWIDGKLMKILLEEVWSKRPTSVDGEVKEIAPKAAYGNASSNEDAVKIATLTPREREIVALVGSGMRNHQLAEHLCISPATARHHLTSIYEKLEVGDRFELAIYAYRNGLASVPK